MKRWPTKPLDELATDLQPGFACRPSERGSELPQIRPLNLTELGTLILHGTKSVECSEAQTERYSLIPRDVLFNNTNSPELVGKVAVFREAGHFVFSNHITRIRVHRDALLPEFLHRFLFKAWSEGFFQHHCTQWVNQAAFNVDALAKLAVPVPPLEEQERIVELLDEADELRKLRVQADRRTAALLPALFHEMFADPAMNLRRLPVTRLGELLEIPPNYGTMVPARADDGEWLSLRVANIQDGGLDLTDRKFVNLPDEELKRHTVSDGDLLLARAIGSKEHLGKCVVVNPGLQKWAFDSHLMRIRLNRKRCKPEWLKALFESKGGRQLFLNNTRQSAVQFNINAEEFGNISVPLPPLEEQDDFLVRVREIRGLEAEQAASRKRLDALFQSMLHRAFRGEL